MVDRKQIGVVCLVKKLGALADTAWAVKICPPRSDGSPDFSAPSTLIMMDALRAVLAGSVQDVPAWLEPAYVKPVAK